MNALLLAALDNHVEVVRTLVGDFGLSVTHRDNVSHFFMMYVYTLCIYRRTVLR